MWKSRLRVAAASALGVAVGVATFLAGLAGAAPLFGGGIQGVYVAAFVALLAALVVFVAVLVVPNRAASSSEKASATGDPAGAMLDERGLKALRKIPCDREGHEKGCLCTVSSHGVALMDLPVWWIDRDGVRHERFVKAGEKTGRIGEGELVDAVEAGTGAPIITKTRAKRPVTPAYAPPRLGLLDRWEMRRQLERCKLQVRAEYEEAVRRDLLRKYAPRIGETAMEFDQRTSEAVRFDTIKRLEELEAEVYRRFGFRE